MIAVPITDTDEIEVIATGMEYAGPQSNDMLCEYRIMRGGYRYVKTEEEVIDGENRLMKVYRRRNKEIRIAV